MARDSGRRPLRWLSGSALACGSAYSVWALAGLYAAHGTTFLPCPSDAFGARGTQEARTREARALPRPLWATLGAAAAATGAPFAEAKVALRNSIANLGVEPLDDAPPASSSGGPWWLLPIVGALGVLAFKILKEPTFAPMDDKAVVSKYFNGEGFERWDKIYGDSDDVNPVQMDIRVGHAETVEKVLGWLGGSVEGKTVCDAGCGTGNLSLPLASQGARVSGSDISAAMVAEAARRAEKSLPETQRPEFTTSDLEKLSGEYDVVCCIDVLIHYPPEKLEAMIGHLAGLSRGRLLLSFAPKTWYYVALKNIGELFPGKAKTTRAYLHAEEVIEDVLNRIGWEVTNKEMTGTKFYFSRLFEAKPKAIGA